MRERIRRLKDKLYTMDTRTMFLERLFLMRQAYEKYKDNPQPILYAHVLDEILSGISIIIDEGDLIVGRIKETIPTSKDEEALKDIHEYYKTVCPDAIKPRKLNVEDRAFSGMPAEQRRDIFNLIAAPSWFSTIGHIIVSWETLLDKGMSGVKELAEKNLRKIKGKDSESLKKREFLEGVTLSCDAVIKYAGRYVETLDELAKKEKDQRKREQLLKIRDVCKQVPVILQKASTKPSNQSGS